MVLAETHHANIVFANGGGGLRPPQPPPLFWAALASFKSKHVNVFGPYPARSCEHSVFKEGGGLRLPLSSSASLLHST